MVQFGYFLKTCSKQSNSVTRQVICNKSKIGGKYQIARISIFDILTFSINFFPVEIDLSGNTVQVFKNSPKLTILGLFDELLSTQNVIVDRFARNVECDFFCDFQTCDMPGG